jgi:hypothetical protein
MSYSVSASPKPSIIFSQNSDGEQPSSPISRIMLDIISDMIRDMAFGMVLPAIRTTAPPIIAPMDPAKSSMRDIDLLFCIGNLLCTKSLSVNSEGAHLV